MPAEGLWVMLSRIGTAYWFLFFLVIAPVVGWTEKPLAVPDSIHTAMKLPVKKED
jgi:ubiquinol-cytochrome c reductase cytochrome b subunit